MQNKRQGFVAGTISETPKLAAILIELESLGFAVQDIGIIGSSRTMQRQAQQLNRPDYAEKAFHVFFNNPISLRPVANTIALVGSNDTCLSTLTELDAENKRKQAPAEIVDELYRVYRELSVSISDNELILIVAVNNASQLVQAAKVFLLQSVQSVHTHLIRLSDVGKIS